MPAFGSLTGGPRRASSGDHGLGRRQCRGAGAGVRPPAALPARRLGRLHLDRHRAGRRQHQPRSRAPPLAEGRRLQLVARGVAVELEALRLGRGLRAGRDGCRDRRCPRRDRTASSLQGRSLPPSSSAADKGKSRDCAAIAVPKPRAMIAKATLLLAAALIALPRLPPPSRSTQGPGPHRPHPRRPRR